MNLLQVSINRIFALSRREELEDDINAELRFHLEMRAQENIERGMAPAEAVLSATRRFGNLNAVKDACRDIRGGGLLEVLRQDLRFALRILRKDRLFTLTAILALAFSIGLTAAVFSVANTVLFRPLPYDHPEQIMALWNRDSHFPERRYPFSYPDFKDIQAASKSFATLGAFMVSNFVMNADSGEASWVRAAHVTPNVFPLLGVEPTLGRTFLESENGPGNRVVVISYDLWQRAFRGGADVIGKSLTLDEQKYEIVGVMPRNFRFPFENQPAEIWTTTSTDAEAHYNGAPPLSTERAAHYMNLVGRLKPGAKRSEAEAELQAAVLRAAAKYPKTNDLFDGANVTPLLNDLTDRAKPVLLTLLAAAFCVLAVACVNITNLRLARATTRQKEIAIRSALGAGSGRILRQFLAESLLIALAVGFLAVLVSVAANVLFVALLPPQFPRSFELFPDWRLLAVGGILTLISSILVGLAPAWHSARSYPAPVLNDCSFVCTETAKGRRIRSLLVVVEIVLSFMLLASTYLLVRNLWLMKHLNPGFNSDNLFTAQLSFPDERDPKIFTRIEDFYRHLRERVSKLPGVESSSAASVLPLTGLAPISQFQLVGEKEKLPQPRTLLSIVTPNYFNTMAIPLIKGRDFTESDRRSSKLVVIVNQSFVRKFLPNQNPLGRVLKSRMSDDMNGPTEKEIVGVVGDVKIRDLTTEGEPEIYFPYAQSIIFSDMTLIARTKLSPNAILPDIRRLVAEADKGVALTRPCLMSEYLSSAVAQPRLDMTVMSIFATMVVILTGLGVYGLMAYVVGQRQHEIGIRFALGAQKGVVFKLIMKQGLRLVVWALGLGIVCTLLLVQVLRPFLSATGGGEFAAVCWVTLFLSIIGWLACWLPARRAAQLDPLVALGQRPAQLGH